tara:strand:+ start:363 stop:476 length:114 start_codon:yes stop_codon:yes gene_type:complete
MIILHLGSKENYKDGERNLWEEYDEDGQLETKKNFKG